MKRWLVAICIFVLGLIVADVLFGVDVPRLIDGFSSFLRDIFRGGAN